MDNHCAIYNVTLLIKPSEGERGLQDEQRSYTREYFKSIHTRYRRASKELKQLILNEFCSNTGYNRKYAIRKLNAPHGEEAGKAAPRQRKPTYGTKVISVLAAVWEAAGYPCSVRLKAFLVLWMPWIRKRYTITSWVENQLLAISARQIDRRLKGKKARIRRRIYGRTKPGTLLKHQIPIKTDNWDIKKARAGPKWIRSLTPATAQTGCSAIRSTRQTFLPRGWKAGRF